MLTPLALFFLVGLAGASLCQKLKLPRIVGMLIVGIALGPYVLDLLTRQFSPFPLSCAKWPSLSSF